VSLASSLPGTRPALALEELALCVGALVHRRTALAPLEMLTGAWVGEEGRAGGSGALQPSLVVVLELVRGVLRRRGKRLRGRRAAGLHDIPCFLTLDHVSCLVAEVQAQPGGTGEGHAARRSHTGRSSGAGAADILHDIVLQIPIRWLADSSNGGTRSAAQLMALATWMLRSCWPQSGVAMDGSDVEEVAGARAGSGEAAAGAGEGVGEGTGATCEGGHQQQPPHRVGAGRVERREKVLRWLAALVATDAGANCPTLPPAPPRTRRPTPFPAVLRVLCCNRGCSGHVCSAL
jgi:hypothetical protein